MNTFLESRARHTQTLQRAPTKVELGTPGLECALLSYDTRLTYKQHISTKPTSLFQVDLNNCEAFKQTCKKIVLCCYIYLGGS